MASLLQTLSSTDTEASGSSLQGCAAWIVEAIELSVVQDKLKRDIAEWGKEPTTRQALETGSRRSAILLKVNKHREDASRFNPVGVGLLSSEGYNANNDEPETLGTYLPSDCSTTIIKSSQLTEKVRSVSIQRGHLQKNRAKYPKSVATTTRASSHLKRLKDRLDQAVWEYTSSYDRLLRLGMSDSDMQKLQPLHAKDVSNIFEEAGKARSLGEGHVRLPWYWRVDLSEGSTQSNDVSVQAQNVQKEYSTSLKVEWFRSRERYKRWKEEVDWIERESASLLLYLHSKSLEWLSRGAIVSSASERAFCLRTSSKFSQERKAQLHQCVVGYILNSSNADLHSMMEDTTFRETLNNAPREPVPPRVWRRCL
ncbi:hypothetical protein RhiJN_21732 [Ceratobasidium sp. AG-Ba]|nr:hypothetical protein RhiJN_20586 [Ceratobasidium sp. AG-Ba]QRV93714.1 hypothetical protein RhiJN_21732 [Ceratobasidium sp. AG-Ba]